MMYAKIVNEETKECSVGLGDNIDFYKSIGMTDMEVEQGYNGLWYVQGYAPQEKPIDEKLAELDARYNAKKTEYTTAYTAAVMKGDTETAEAIKGYLDTLDDDYDAAYDRIVGEEEE